MSAPAAAATSNTMAWLTVAIFCVGLLVPVQSGVNAQLNKLIANPIAAGFISFSVGTTAMLIPMLLTAGSWQALPKAIGAPWWAFVGGIIGAVFVVVTLQAVPKIGAATTLSLLVAGQLLSSLVFDHYGWLNMPQHPVNWMRILGVTLLVAGVVLIRKF